MTINNESISLVKWRTRGRFDCVKHPESASSPLKNHTDSRTGPRLNVNRLGSWWLVNNYETKMMAVDRKVFTVNVL